VELDQLKTNVSLLELQTAKHCAPTRRGFVRFYAVELVLTGQSKEIAATMASCSVRTIERWLRLYEKRGIDGLAIKGRSGRPRKISKQRFGAEIVPLVLDPSMVGETHFTGVKLHGYLVKGLKEQLSYRTVLNYMHDLARVIPRPWPDRQDPEKREQYSKEIDVLKQDDSVELWFADETGIEGDPRPRKVWVKKGTRPNHPYLGDHLRLNVIGAVAPVRGDLFSLIVPHVDTEVFQVFVNELAEYTKQSSKQIVLVLDNASWHKSASIKWHHIKPKYLPPYSPDFNPIEIVWLCLKRDFFTSWFAKTADALLERTVFALRSFISNSAAITSITNH